VRSEYDFTAIEACEDGAALASTNDRVIATDTDAGTTIQYSIKRNDRGAMQINSSTGVLSVRDCSQLDFEIAGSRPVYFLCGIAHS